MANVLEQMRWRRAPLQRPRPLADEAGAPAVDVRPARLLLLRAEVVEAAVAGY